MFRWVTLLAAVVVAASIAGAQKPLADGVYASGPDKRGSIAATAVDMNGNSTPVFIAPRRVATANEHLFSNSNNNDVYVFWLETRRTWKLGAWPVLRIGGATLRASSTGSGVTRGFNTVSFNLDRATADRVARRYKIPRRDRRDLSPGVRWRFRPVKSSFAAGEPVLIELEVWSDSSSPVAMIVGGRNRGVRNNRFDFEVFKSGQTLAIKDAPDFGGLSTTVTLGKGGKKASPRANLRSWADLPPGAYNVRCRYALELVDASSRSARWPDHGHERWDMELTGNVTVAVH